MAKDHLRDYDTTAANNTDADGVSIAEGWAPANVNNAMREIMADLAEFHGDIAGALTTAGSGNAYTLTTNDGLTAYAAGTVYMFFANRANTGAATLNVNGIGARSILTRHDRELFEGDIERYQVCLVVYEANDDVFQLVSIPSRGPTHVDTLQATTSGAEFDFTPADQLKRATIIFRQVSLSGTDNYLIQLGTSGGIVTTGYASLSTVLTTGANTQDVSNDGFIISGIDAASVMSGRIVIENIGGTEWVASGQVRNGASASVVFNGHIDLGAAITTIRLTRDGTDTFDNGSANAFYES